MLITNEDSSVKLNQGTNEEDQEPGQYEEIKNAKEAA